jgi:hypothetical protein
MKKIILMFIFFLFFALVPHVFAQTVECVPGKFCALAPIPGLTDDTGSGSILGSDSFALFFNNLYKFMLGLAIALAIIEIIWGGLQYSTTDSIGNKEAGKTRIRNAILGLILILSPVLVFSIINPNILNLSISLTPIVP